MSQHKATWRNNSNTNLWFPVFVVVALLTSATMIALQTDHQVSFPQLAAPAVSAASAEKTIDIGGGYVLKQNAKSGAVIPASPLIVKSNYKSVDIGGGYVLKTNAEAGLVVPSSPALVKSGRDAAFTQTMDLGGGYVLKYNAEAGVVAPSSPAVLQSKAEASFKTMDLGAGYTLKFDGNGATIQAPESRPVIVP